MAGGDAAGGSHGLAELIELHGESLVADFERFYRPLPEMMRSGSSPRYLLALIRQLPLESAFIADMRGGPQFRDWTVERYLQAIMVDAINNNTHVLAKANGGKGRRPEPIYKPEKAKPKTNMFATMARAKLRAAQQKKE